MYTKGKWKVTPTKQPGRNEFWIGSPIGRNLIARIKINSTDDKEAEANYSDNKQRLAQEQQDDLPF